MPEQELINDPEDIRLNEQDEIAYILGNPPGWILRWGITLVFLSAIIFAILAWLIKYPDIVDARVTLTTQNPPIRVVALSSGKLEELNVQDKQKVDEGTVLAILDSPANWKDVLVLDSLIELRASTKINSTNIQFPEKLKLGSLQNGYSRFTENLKNYRYYINNDITRDKALALEEQIKNINLLSASLEKSKKTLLKEVNLAKKNYAREENLEREGGASKLDVERAETNYLQYQRQYDRVDEQIINNQISIDQLNLQILELKQGNDDNKSGRRLTINEDILRLKSEVETWKKRYLILSPIKGAVSLAKVWSKNQFLTTNQEVMTIIPEEDAGVVLGKAVLPISGSGKVKSDMVANIRLDGYPYQEFGIIKGTIKSISAIPNESNYNIEIEMPEKLITSYGEEIEFRQEMQGVARIITEDRRIFERIFDRIFNILYNE